MMDHGTTEIMEGVAMAWLRVEVGVSRNRKTKRFAREAGITVRSAIGALWLLWEATREQAPDGNLAGWSDEEIADVIEGKVDEVLAMVTAGFLEGEPGARRVHEWMTHNGQHIRDAIRKRDERAEEATKVVQGGLALVPPEVLGRPGMSTDVPGVSSYGTDETNVHDGQPCAATPRADADRETWKSILPFERDLIDRYLGIQGSPEGWWESARATILTDPEWRTTVGAMKVPKEVLEAAEGNKQRVLELMDEIDAKRVASGKLLNETTARETKAAIEKRRGPARVHVGAVYDITKGLTKEQQRAGLQVTQRLFNAGVTSPRLLTAVARHYVDHAANIRNPFAYYSPGGEGFEWLRGKIGAEDEVAVHEAIRRADAKWLVGGVGEAQA